MPDFSYIARDLRGQRITGTLSAASEAEVVAVLSGRSLFPVQVAAEKTGSSSPFRLGGRVKGQVMAMTYSQLAALMRSGVPLLRAIHVIREQTSHPKLKEVLSDVHARVEDGTTLGDAMSRHPRVFSEMTLNMVRAGGEGGFLE
ncbi:MAG: type II secretion system F family protein, partial [Planctomycetales bacterium]|nr:type II secretion system F family protein [Planctomycetales bacterium]